MSLNINEPSCSQECKVCNNVAHGIHFGVPSCRACAAFFRRSIVLNKSYMCRRADSKCKIDKSERYLCRFCRLQKCKSLGMTAENVQWNRDTFSSTQKSVIVETPGFKVKTELPPLYDITGMVEKINKCFDNFELPENDKTYASRSALGRMEYALQIYRKHQKKHGLEISTGMEFVDMVNKWGDGTCRVANWMMHSEEFRKLESENKLAILKLVWMVWSRFERLTISIEVFGRKAYDERIFITSDTHAIHMNRTTIDVSMITDHSSESIRMMFEPLCQKMFDDVAKPLIEIEPTSIEVTYMLCQIFWHNSGKTLQGDTLAASEKFLDEIGNDLHVYYVKERKTPNYASRLARMMSAVHSILRHHKERLKLFELARLFDVFKVKLSDPIDIFEG